MKAMIWLGGPVLGFAIVAAASYSVKSEPTVELLPVSAVETVALTTGSGALDACCVVPETSTVAAESACPVNTTAHTKLASHDSAAACPHDATKTAGTKATTCPQDEGTLAAKRAPAPAHVVAEAK
jgi:hypothetical protein